MKAKRSNRVYSISEQEVAFFQGQGYDIYDDNGVLIQYGAGKTVSMEKYIALKKENDRLKSQIDALSEKLEAAKKKAKTK